MTTKIYKNDKEDRHSHKIAKVDGPAPGLYDIENSVKKT
jgi:hypothetical protein